jgi:5-methyltetrahydrofolate--homocysteine methyltransferase
MIKAVSDRLAEAFAEYIHMKIRREYWGHEANETLDAEDLLNCKYKGIRPAVGYPMQPDHTENLNLFKLLNVEEHTTIKLTDSLAMWPPNSVSALVFGSDQAYYFSLQEICKDQIEDYSKRKNVEVRAMEKWLKPNLGYDLDWEDNLV